MFDKYDFFLRNLQIQSHRLLLGRRHSAAHALEQVLPRLCERRARARRATHSGRGRARRAQLLQAFVDGPGARAGRLRFAAVQAEGGRQRCLCLCRVSFKLLFALQRQRAQTLGCRRRWWRTGRV